LELAPGLQPIAAATISSVKVLIFGNPKAGTPLMSTAPRLAIDLSLNALVAEDYQGRVWGNLHRGEIPEGTAWRAPRT
jgi:uncharacterized protein (DUF302 family)